MPYYPPASGGSPSSGPITPGFAAYRSGKVYSPFPQGAAASVVTGGPTITVTYYMPFTVMEDVAISELGFLVSTLGGNAHLAIYSHSTDRPGGAAPLCKTGPIDCSATGHKNATLLTAAGAALPSLTLERDTIYWMGAQFDNAAIRYTSFPAAFISLSALIGADAFTDFSTTVALEATSWTVTGTTAGTWPDATSASFVRDNLYRTPAFKFKVA